MKVLWKLIVDKMLLVLASLVVLIILFVFLYILINIPSRKDKGKATANRLGMIAIELLDYQYHQGKFPEGNSNEISNELLKKGLENKPNNKGNFNGKGKKITDSQYDFVDSGKNYLDGWGNRIHISIFRSGNICKIVSFGANGTDDRGVGDDIVMILENNKRTLLCPDLYGFSVYGPTLFISDTNEIKKTLNKLAPKKQPDNPKEPEKPKDQTK